MGIPVENLGTRWADGKSLNFFVLHHVPVDSACINIVTQDRGTRVPPVKSFRVCLSTSCAYRHVHEPVVPFRLDVELEWELELDLEPNLDWRMDLDSEHDKGLDLESTWCTVFALSLEYALFLRWTQHAGGLPFCLTLSKCLNWLPVLGSPSVLLCFAGAILLQPSSWQCMVVVVVICWRNLKSKLRKKPHRGLVRESCLAMVGCLRGGLAR